MRSFKLSSKLKRYLTAIVAGPPQESTGNKSWMIKKVNWTSPSDTGHLGQGGSYMTFTPFLLIIRDPP